MLAVIASSVLALALAQAPMSISPPLEQSPCGGDLCTLEQGVHAKRLNTAYFSAGTTDEDRAKMKQIIAAHTINGTTDWAAAAEQYFNGRSAALGQPPIYDAHAIEEADAKGIEASATLSAAQQRISLTRRSLQEAEFRKLAEAAVQQRLVDPSSAQFDWPYGFTLGEWKPFIGKRVSGYWSCGTVNARNRMGGYNGAVSFVVVVDPYSPQVKFVDVGNGRDFDVVSMQCSKSIKFLPPAVAHGSSATEVAGSRPSVADELEKLAALLDKGILTQAEFDAQKMKLLANQP